MKRIAAGVITIGVVIIVIAFVTTIIGNIDATKINGTEMESVWNSTTIYTNITLNLLTPITLIIGISLLIYALYKIAKRR